MGRRKPAPASRLRGQDLAARFPASSPTVNVAAEEREANSLLHWYQQIIALKKRDPALHQGEEIMLDTSNEHVLSWLRKAPDGEAVVVACNFTAQPQPVSIKLSAQGIQGSHFKTLMKTPGAPDPQSLDLVQLGPYGVYIGQVAGSNPLCLAV